MMKQVKKPNWLQIYFYPPKFGKEVAVPVGKLRREPLSKHYFYRYDTEYLERGRAFGAIDPANLPLGDRQFDLGDKLSGVFADSAPDSWGRRVIFRTYNREDMNELEFVAAPDSSRVGCLDFGQMGNGIPDLSCLGEYQEIARKIEKKEDVSPKILKRLYHGASIGGSRPKANVLIDGEIWLAKLKSHADEWCNARVEMFAMQLAKRCGIDIPEMRIYDDDTLLIKRFDRFNKMRRWGYFSARTMLGLKKDEAGSYKNLAIKMRQYGMKDSCVQLFLRMIFNGFIRNIDDHAQNHGFLHDGTRIWLAPAFDILPISWALNMRGKANLAMNIGKYGQLINKENFLSTTPAFGLEIEEAKAIYENMLDAINMHWGGLLEEYKLDANDRERLNPIIEYWSKYRFSR